MITRKMYVLAVPDLRASAVYYRDVLGFAIREIGDDGWRIFEREGCQIMAGHCPDATPPAELGDHSYFAYIVVDDAGAYFREFSSTGAQFTKRLRDEPWKMREFGVRTLDGHRIMFGQEL
jgi:catechol 2,3-dioxygenase-like lactoylglutathione lyase family enzyme